MKNFKKTSMLTVVFLLAFASLKAQEKTQSIGKRSDADIENSATNPSQKSGINGINNNSMPNRISMNVTVAKQTQGATFGEMVNSGKINVTLVEGGCVVFFLPMKATESIQPTKVSTNCPKMNARRLAKK